MTAFTFLLATLSHINFHVSHDDMWLINTCYVADWFIREYFFIESTDKLYILLFEKEIWFVYI
jgi:hypothetical protein